ncbi:hypothetical protein [Sneathiella sp.]|uniref:hypothetical protein n=1 Tax=Sneathiella sp. TaxID=1964365 RepID=UPI0035681D18
MAIGAGVDLGFQLYENDGQWECVDWASVAISGGIGGIVPPVFKGFRYLTKIGSWIKKPPFWSSTKSRNAVENAFDHYMKDGKQFPEYQNASQYVKGAQKFTRNPPNGTLTKSRPNGDKLLYNPQSNTFAVKNSSGAPKTMFRPAGGSKYWNNQ